MQPNKANSKQINNNSDKACIYMVINMVIDEESSPNDRATIIALSILDFSEDLDMIWRFPSEGRLIEVNLS